MYAMHIRVCVFGKRAIIMYKWNVSVNAASREVRVSVHATVWWFNEHGATHCMHAGMHGIYDGHAWCTY